MGRMVQMERMRLRNLRGGPQSPESEASEDPETGGRGPRLSSFPKDIVASCLHIQQRRKHSDTLKCCKFWVELTTKPFVLAPSPSLARPLARASPARGPSTCRLAFSDMDSRAEDGALWQYGEAFGLRAQRVGRVDALQRHVQRGRARHDAPRDEGGGLRRGSLQRHPEVRVCHVDPCGAVWKVDSMTSCGVHSIQQSMQLGSCIKGLFEQIRALKWCPAGRKTESCGTQSCDLNQDCVLGSLDPDRCVSSTLTEVGALDGL